MKKKKIIGIIICIIVIIGVVIHATIECCVHYGIDFKIAIIIEVLFGFMSLILLLIKMLKNMLNDVNREYFYIKEYDNKEIRLSFSYLFRIRINEKYLLIKRQDRDIYQPVGGVYQVKNWRYLHEKLKCYRDSSKGEPNDIRVKIKGKNIKNFIKWFKNKEDREITPNREFKEELLDSGILPAESFLNVEFRFDRYYYQGVQYSQVYNKLELLRFDIYDVILTKEQLTILSEINKKEIKCFSENEIKTLGVTDNSDKRKMGTQTPYILEEV